MRYLTNSDTSLRSLVDGDLLLSDDLLGQLKNLGIIHIGHLLDRVNSDGYHELATEVGDESYQSELELFICHLILKEHANSLTASESPRRLIFLGCGVFIVLITLVLIFVPVYGPVVRLNIDVSTFVVLDRDNHQIVHEWFPDNDVHTSRLNGRWSLVSKKAGDALSIESTTGFVPRIKRDAIDVLELRQMDKILEQNEWYRFTVHDDVYSDEFCGYVLHSSTQRLLLGVDSELRISESRSPNFVIKPSINVAVTNECTSFSEEDAD